MGRKKKIIESEPSIVVQETALAAQSLDFASPPAIVIDATPVQKYDYKFLYATLKNVSDTNWEALFDEMGRNGYRFVGESAGRSVFEKPVS